ncbi:hypothetical protein AOXY_G34408 [Acipenser oxyrinchus oxyrinchus]|uniref:Uncharacterized protein n=1 Tax=Acipenser oxyrinchus oxyrinchus TaxID=40147 RepID=A0AAD8FNE2_ACIOX|nr:hypothetical protein AOXY_G34408 [Acipenser oxyrinchus oxyrinchus]
MSLQEQQQYWYKQHLQSLQKLKQQQKNEKAKASKLPGGDQPLTTSSPPHLHPWSLQKGTPTTTSQRAPPLPLQRSPR